MVEQSNSATPRPLWQWQWDYLRMLVEVLAYDTLIDLQEGISDFTERQRLPLIPWTDEGMNLHAEAQAIYRECHDKHTARCKTELGERDVIVVERIKKEVGEERKAAGLAPEPVMRPLINSASKQEEHQNISDFWTRVCQKYTQKLQEKPKRLRSQTATKKINTTKTDMAPNTTQQDQCKNIDPDAMDLTNDKFNAETPESRELRRDYYEYLWDEQAGRKPGKLFTSAMKAMNKTSGRGQYNKNSKAKKQKRAGFGEKMITPNGASIDTPMDLADLDKTIKELLGDEQVAGAREMAAELNVKSLAPPAIVSAPASAHASSNPVVPAPTSRRKANGSLETTKYYADGSVSSIETERVARNVVFRTFTSYDKEGNVNLKADRRGSSAPRITFQRDDTALFDGAARIAKGDAAPAASSHHSATSPTSDRIAKGDVAPASPHHPATSPSSNPTASLLPARHLNTTTDNLTYPTDTITPKAFLKHGTRRYSHDFLLQFRTIVTWKPCTDWDHRLCVADLASEDELVRMALENMDAF